MDVAQETLHFAQHVAAPVADVWHAYADLDERLSWGAPDTDGIAYDVADFRTGGEDRYRCGPPGDLHFVGRDRYHLVEPEEGFVVTGTVHRDDVLLAVAVVTWRLEDLGDDGTRVTIVDQVTSLIGDGMIDGHRHGHRATLAQLARRFDTSS